MFKFGLLGKGIGVFAHTNCLIPLIQLTDGWYGFDTAQTPTGVIDPTHTESLLLRYSIKFDAISGDWIVQFGDAGNEKSESVDNGVIEFDIDGADDILLTWSEVNLRYEGNDLTTAGVVADEIGSEVCFATVFIADSVSVLLDDDGIALTTDDGQILMKG